MKNLPLLLSSLFLVIILMPACRVGKAASSLGGFQMISGYQGDLQQLIDEAPDYAILRFSPADEYVVEKTITIDKPLTLDGFTGRLPDDAGILMFAVRHEGVTIRNFTLTGNAETVSQENRKALLHVSAGRFRIEDCRFYNSSKDGVEISNLDERPIEDGVIRNIVGDGNMRDLISINGENDGHINHLLVENIRAYNGALRGAVEVSDGTENITVRKVYAESCVYAIDVQDHGYPGAVNDKVLIEGVIAKNCRHAIRTANSDIGHARHIFRDITAENCAEPLRITNVRGVYVENVLIRGHEGEASPLFLSNCRDVTLSNIVLEDIRSQKSALALFNSDLAYIDHMQLAEDAESEYGIDYEINNGHTYQSLMIVNSFLRSAQKAGIRLSSNNGSILKEKVLQNNVATLTDRLQAED